jgi:hypothetical protein
VESKKKLIKEQLAFLEHDLRKHGITEYDTRMANTGHMIVSFLVNGIPRALTIAGSVDRNARLRNRTMLRGILEGRR